MIPQRHFWGKITKSNESELRLATHLELQKLMSQNVEARGVTYSASSGFVRGAGA
jgi:hypothetical protein